MCRPLRLPALILPSISVQDVNFIHRLPTVKVPWSDLYLSEARVLRAADVTDGETPKEKYSASRRVWYLLAANEYLVPRSVLARTVNHGEEWRRDDANDLFKRSGGGCRCRS